MKNRKEAGCIPKRYFQSPQRLRFETVRICQFLIVFKSDPSTRGRCADPANTGFSKKRKPALCFANPIHAVLIGLFVMGSSAIVAAQDDPAAEPQNRTFALYAVTPAFATGESSAINDMLLNNGYPRIPRGNLNWGLGGQYRWNRLIFGVDLMASYQTRYRENENTQLMRKALTTNLWAGFYAYRRSVFSIYPFTGLSVTDALFYFTSPTPAASLSGLLATPGNTVHVRHFATGIMVGLGVDLQDTKRSNSVFQSIRISHRFSPEGVYAWESAFTPLWSMPRPTVSITGLFS
jgi:hypothetical protein